LKSPNRSLYLAGAKKGPWPRDSDHHSGQTDWDWRLEPQRYRELCLTGTKPDLDKAEGLMAKVIEAGIKNIKREDAFAIADYLKSIPPITNKIK
jgi:hypothetical protein